MMKKRFIAILLAAVLIIMCSGCAVKYDFPLTASQVASVYFYEETWESSSSVSITDPNSIERIISNFQGMKNGRAFDPNRDDDLAGFSYYYELTFTLADGSEFTCSLNALGESESLYHDENVYMHVKNISLTSLFQELAEKYG